MPEIFSPEMLPFLGAFIFVFALVFGLLSYVNKFHKAVNLLIAAVFGLFSVLFEPLVTGLQVFLPIAAIIFIILFFVLILTKVFEGQKKDAVPLVVSLAILLLLLGLFWPQLGFEIAGISSTNMLWLAGVIIIILIFYMSYSQPSS